MQVGRVLVKGNEAVVKGAILAGCRSFYGYPITPASEIAETAAQLMPRIGGTFLQAESEIASINMCYGAAAAGERTLTASSSPGISLKQEGISYSACAELPIVFVDIMRGGPGLGNIAPEQADYNQIVKGGGHGSYKVIVLAPNGAQEMCDLAILAFELAEKYRNPACILTDGFIGQMMEPVEFPEQLTNIPRRSWAVEGTPETQDNLVSSIYLAPDDLEAHIRKLERKYEEIARTEVRFEEYRIEGAEYVAIAYGIVSRLLETAIDMARDEGIKIGMLRPITLWPFPQQRLSELAETVKGMLVVELSTGQMVDDVRLSVEGKSPVRLCSRVGGNVPTAKEIRDHIVKLREVTQ